jgi:GNAT superfamily N-acetyltransferase
VNVRIFPAPVPASAEDAGAWALRASVAVERSAQVDTWGHADFAETYDEAAAWARDQRYGARHRYVAVEDDLAVDDDAAGDDAVGDDDRAADDDVARRRSGEGMRQRVLGTAVLELPSPDNTHLASAWVAVDPAFRNRGVGSALADHLEREARAAGRRLVHSWSDHARPPEPAEDAFVPGTGRGAVPKAPGSRFALAHGYVLEQVERHSFLELPVPGEHLDRLAAGAAAVAGADYRLRTWTDESPEERLAAYAVLHTRMSTDVPLGGLDFEEDVFDAAKVRDMERVHRESGHHLLVAAAEHVLSGVLAAFTVLVVREDTAPAVFQDSTLVLREHRGRRLGLLVKVANVRALQAAFPAAARVHTWNAFENAYMVAINDALGFLPGGVQGQWQKALA